MKTDKITALINKGIELGIKGSFKLSDVHDDLDLLLEASGKDAIIRDYFDCWADAINHDYMVYKTRDPKEWIDAAVELKTWYVNTDCELSKRNLWNETISISL